MSAYTDGVFDGVMTSLFLGLPAMGATFYGIACGFSTKQRAERAYRRRLNRVAAEFMAMGYPPYSSMGSDAYDLARAQLRKEAEEVRSIEL